MKRQLGIATASALVAFVLAAGTVAAWAPNQGDPSKVLKVDNPHVSCQSPVPGKKVEGNFGRYIEVYANAPIDFVTVKSGQGASVVYASFQYKSGKIKLSKDVSNYVVWTCPKY